jgi:hypothetical protein
LLLPKAKVLLLFKGLWGGGATPHGLIFVQEVFGGLEPTHRQSGRQAKGLLLPLGKSAFFFDKKGSDVWQINLLI